LSALQLVSFLLRGRRKPADSLSTRCEISRLAKRCN
jgi:hypothetical protein